jgi:AraC-like DNA-binding protein
MNSPTKRRRGGDLTRRPLLERSLEDGELQFRYLRSVGVEPQFPTSDRARLVCLRGASRGVVSIARRDLLVDTTSMLWIPPGKSAKARPTSILWDAMTLLPSETYLRELISENPLGVAEAHKLRNEPFVLRRSRWLDDIIERYFYERGVNRETPLGCTFFLEKQILNEVARLAFPSRFQTAHGDPLVGPSDPAAEALQYIEAHLFEELSLDDVASKAGVAKNTLLVVFRTAFGTTPYAYVKARRLDEAARMLQTGDYQVTDVCGIVGYGDLSAFSKAVRERFGKAPSEFLPG